MLFSGDLRDGRADAQREQEEEVWTENLLLQKWKGGQKSLSGEKKKLYEILIQVEDPAVAAKQLESLEKRFKSHTLKKRAFFSS